MNVDDVIMAAYDTLKQSADAKHQCVVIRTDATVRVLGDTQRLQQIVWNLLSDAVKFTPEGGRITVDVRATMTHVRVVVRDTGVGIDPAFVPYMFNRFTQADASPTRGRTRARPRPRAAPDRTPWRDDTGS